MDTTKTKLGSSFKWLNATQFLGAFNDNIFKLLVILLLIELQSDSEAGNVTALAGAVFVMPFLLFSALAGKLADSFSKRNIIVSTKVAELLLMVAGCAAFMFESVIGLYIVLFLMATQSAFFAPSKYGIVPELVKSEQLSQANGLLEALTYLAIVVGTASALLLSKVTGSSFTLMGLVCVFIAAVGLIVSLPIERTAAAGGERRVSVFFVRDIWRTLWLIRRNHYLVLAVLASAYFLLIGGLIYTNLIPYGIEHLGFDKEHSSQLFIIVAVGIGLGAYLAGKLSGRNVEFGVVPLGAIGLTVSAVGLGLTGGRIPAFVLIFLMGVSGGLFIVPIHSFIQLRSPQKRRGQVLAASNFLGWVGVLLASGLIYLVCGLLGASAAHMFIVLGVLTFVLSVITVILLPDFLVRFLCVLLARLCYRIKAVGIENIPADKSALLVCNHVSWVDALLVGATQQRRIRFVMDKDFYNIWWLKPLCKLMKAIPISAGDPPKKIISSLRQARTAMDEGFLVCIFAEGTLTRSGMMAEFKGGFERIIKGSNYDIIPVYLGGVWGSIFSYYSGRVLSTLPKKFPYPISIHFGKGMPTDSSVSQIRQKVTELSCEYFDSLKSPKRSLIYHFVKTARKNWQKRCISDSTGKRLNYGQTLLSAIALAERIDEIAEADAKVGILLPPSTGGALGNLAVTVSGRIAVNLNYTISDEARSVAIAECGIRCIISSRSFLEKAGISGTLDGVVFLEDIATKVEWPARVKAYLKARFLPLILLTKGRKRCGDELATVIFSSGSSGKPKGVKLSHHNIISNIEAVRMVIHIRQDDNFCGVLPFFHSFGFNCGLWFPLISGVSISYIANPLDGLSVGRSVRENHSTILFASPTFLLNYSRRLKREDFSSLRLVAAGAEKLKRRLADMFEERFGIRPLEGYGTTELSPVVSLNVPDIEVDGVYQVGTKDGSVGHPLPGVVVKIVDIETKKPLAIGEEGLLLLKGPNVMAGYLNMQEQTSEVLKDGWYNTGDIARVDADGFITITDRLSRFSKIGGEMVPHIDVEQAYLQGLDTHEQVVAVTSVPDPKKGEELIVLHLDEAGSADKLHEIIAKSELPNIWKPRRSNYIRIESMPALGSGKIDIMKLRKIALAAKSGGDS
ncbi:MAG: acyl-[ACP]--phospholipid O-acyltransferase [Planctomycetota bacterium]|jgi:acyl-[acyl-carrier-protein]-phospholipid O-acyltransferase/long-chain-fatty-acid--[acyl-carrier-protein] ligase